MNLRAFSSRNWLKLNTWCVHVEVDGQICSITYNSDAVYHSLFVILRLHWKLFMSCKQFVVIWRTTLYCEIAIGEPLCSIGESLKHRECFEKHLVCWGVIWFHLGSEQHLIFDWFMSISCWRRKSSWVSGSGSSNRRRLKFSPQSEGCLRLRGNSRPWNSIMRRAADSTLSLK